MALQYEYIHVMYVRMKVHHVNGNKRDAIVLEVASV